MPIALVSLVEKERQWFKSVVGLQASSDSLQLPACEPYTDVARRQLLQSRQCSRMSTWPLQSGYSLAMVSSEAGALAVAGDGDSLGATSFCAWTLIPVNPEVLVVEDATQDPRCAAPDIVP